MLNTLGDLIKGWFHTFGYGGIVLAMALESCLIPLPSEIIMPVAGTFIGSAGGSGLHFNLLGVALSGSIGCVLGSIAAYWLGATGGRPVIFKYGKYILVSRHDFDLAERWFNRWGGGVTFFSRLLPIVRTYISLPAGMSRMNFTSFVLFTFLGSLPWCLALAYAGQQLGSRFGDSIGKILHDFDYVIGAAVVILLALYVWRHFRNERAYDQQHAAPAAGQERPAPRTNNYGAPANNAPRTPRSAQASGREFSSDVPPNYQQRTLDPNGPDAPTIKTRTIRPPR